MCRPLSSAILDFTITKYGDDQVHDFFGFLDPQNLAKDTKIISLVHFFGVMDDFMLRQPSWTPS